VNGFFAPSAGNSSQIVLAKSDGTGQQILAHPGESDLDPSFSPRGDRLLYVRVRSGSRSHQIVASDLSGARLRVVTPMTGDDPAWSPDGGKVLFTHQSAIWTVSFNGRAARKLIPNAIRASWSPTGKRIVFIGRDRRVHTASADGGDQVKLRITSSPLAHWDALFAVYSPHGTSIAFATDADLSGRNLDPSVYTIATSGGRSRLVDTYQGATEGAVTGLSWQSRR
jgi:Tol biopolymer transport system component